MSGLRYSYVTNGLADHRIDDALVLLADNGYSGVGLTLDHQHLDPFAPDVAARVDHIARRADALGLAIVVETGGRFVLDPTRKHEPTLIGDDGRERRVDFLVRAVDIAADLGARAVSFWAGVPAPGLDPAVAWDRLVAGCSSVLEAADRRDVLLAFEPEPGMLVATLDDWERLARALDDRRFGMTLDLGHCHCIEEEAVEACVRRAGDRLYNVHVEDMRRGVHEHLDFGEGTFDVAPALAALGEAHYRGLVSVELSRHSHMAHRTVPSAIAHLRKAEREGSVAAAQEVRAS